MKQLIRGRHAPAMVIAVLALVAAVTGAAVASPSATESKGALSKKKVKNIATNVANSRIAALAPTLSVKSAQTATTANQLSMYAQVSSGGGFVGSKLGIGSVTKAGTGLYCFTGLARTPIGGQATADYNDSGTDFAQFGLGRDISGLCPANTQAFVGTFRSLDPPAITNSGFFVTIY